MRAHKHQGVLIVVVVVLVLMMRGSTPHNPSSAGGAVALNLALPPKSNTGSKAGGLFNSGAVAEHTPRAESLPSFNTEGDSCVRRPLTNISQCTCLYHCVAYGGFFLMHIYKATATSMGPDHRLALMFGAALRQVSKTWSDPGVVVDIGANDGQDIVHWYNEFAGPERNSPALSGRHFLIFEPQDKYISELEKIIVTNDARFNNKVKGYVLNGGAGTTEQHGKTLYLVGDGFTARLADEKDPEVAVSFTSPADGGEAQSTLPKVKMYSIEKALQERGLGKSPISFLKVDAEGADATLLHGSLNLFKTQRVQLGIMELNGRFAPKFPIPIPQVVEEIRSFGYRLFMLGISGNRPILTEMPKNSLGHWPVQLETLVFVMETSGLLESTATTGAVNLEPAMRQKVLGRMALKHFSGARIKDCLSLSTPTDIHEYCFGDVLGFPGSGGRPLGKRTQNLF